MQSYFRSLEMAETKHIDRLPETQIEMTCGRSIASPINIRSDHSTHSPTQNKQYNPCLILLHREQGQT